MRHNRLILALIVLGSCLSVAWAAPAEPRSVLDAIPSDAWAAVIVRDLKGLNDKVIEVGQQLGLPIGPGTMAGDPLMMAKGMLGIMEGLNDNGSVALVLLKTDQLTADAFGKSVVLLVPCTDAPAFIEQFATTAPATAADTQASKPAAPPEGITAIELMGKPSFAAVKGGYALVAPEPDAIVTMLKADTSIRESISPDRLALMEKQFDVVIMANVAAAGPALKDTVKNAMMTFMMMATMADPSMASQAEQLITKVDQFLNEASNLQIALALDKAGVSLDFFVQVKPDTPLAKELAACKASEKSLLRGLPADAYILAAGFPTQSSPEKTEQAKVALRGLLDKPMVKQAVDPTKLEDAKKLIDQLVDIGAHGEWSAVSLSALSGEAGKIGLTAVGSIPHGAEKWLRVMRDLIQTGLAMVTDEDIKPILEKFKYNAEAEKIGDAVVDQVVVDLSGIEELDEEDMAKLKTLFGEEGLLFRLAALDPDHVALLFGGGPERVAQVAALCKAGEAPLAANAGIQAIAPHLPKGNRFVEAYIAVDTLLALVKDVAPTLGGEDATITAEVPTIGVPAAVIGVVGKDTQRLTIFVPMQVITGVKDFVTTIMAEKMMPMETESQQDSSRP
ncbi:MAG: hypothetical protein JXA69_14735 [Phycisphaerae bacterium]|nr:hypothetical protein [Phycisphaerae bacterium]